MNLLHHPSGGHHHMHPDHHALEEAKLASASSAEQELNRLLNRRDSHQVNSAILVVHDAAVEDEPLEQ